MSAGRKKSKSVKIEAPPPVTQYQATVPTGEQYITTRQGNKELHSVILSPSTRQTVQTSQAALNNLADELNQPDAKRVRSIAKRSRDFYDLQAQNINDEADDALSRGQSDLSKRFGGTFNSTFGADYLARLERNRLSQLYSAGKEAALLGEDLYSRDEDSRMQRFQLFNNYLTDQNNAARGIADTGSQVLQNETNRTQNLSIARANAVQNAMNTELQTDTASKNAKLNAAMKGMGMAVQVAAML